MSSQPIFLEPGVEEAIARFFKRAKPSLRCRILGHDYEQTVETYGDVVILARCSRCPWAQWTRFVKPQSKGTGVGDLEVTILPTSSGWGHTGPCGTGCTCSMSRSTG